eukprot:scaffold151194_cov34-Tisochrysis_lutea.AAC.1
MPSQWTRTPPCKLFTAPYVTRTWFPPTRFLCSHYPLLFVTAFLAASTAFTRKPSARCVVAVALPSDCFVRSRGASQIIDCGTNNLAAVFSAIDWPLSLLYTYHLPL